MDDEDGEKLHIMAYKVMAESAERTSDRRLAANSAYLVITGGLAGLDAFLIERGQFGVVAVVSIAGMLVSALWAATLIYYRGLSAAKFSLLAEFEGTHRVVGYQREWELFSKRSAFAKLGVSLSTLEVVIACIAFLGHFAVLLLYGVR